MPEEFMKYLYCLKFKCLFTLDSLTNSGLELISVQRQYIQVVAREIEETN